MDAEIVLNMVDHLDKYSVTFSSGYSWSWKKPIYCDYRLTWAKLRCILHHYLPHLPTLLSVCIFFNLEYKFENISACTLHCMFARRWRNQNTKYLSLELNFTKFCYSVWGEKEDSADFRKPATTRGYTACPSSVPLRICKHMKVPFSVCKLALCTYTEHVNFFL